MRRGKTRTSSGNQVTRAKIAAIAIAVLLTALAALLVGFWDYELEATKRAMLATAHPCPAGTTEKIERAGEVGWLRLCVRGGVRHGPFVYWKKQHKYAAGTFDDGKQMKVSYFDESGKAIRVEEVK